MAFGHSIDQRKINKRNHIIDLFRRHSVISKAMARSLSGYSMDTIISIFNTLLDEEIIVPTEGKQKAKGRKAHFFSLNDEKNLYLGITFNQSGIYSSIVSLSHTTKESFNTKLNLGLSKDDFLNEFKEHIKAVTNSTQSLENFTAIGCSIPGDIDLKTGILHSYTLMPFLKQLNFADFISEIFPDIPVLIDHNIHSMSSYIMRDRNLLADNRNILFISARSGTANGLIYNGQIATGHGELGHVKVSDEKDQCICGRYGCLDCYFSYRRFMELLSDHTGKDYINSANGFEDDISSLDYLAELYRENTAGITDELDKRLYFFTMALIDIVNVTVPDLVILSGELLKVYGNPVEAINRVAGKEFKSSGFVDRFFQTKIKFKDLGTEIAALGVCYELIRRDWNYQTGELT